MKLHQQGLYAPPHPSRRESSIRTGMKQQWSVARVSDQSESRMIYGKVRARLRMPASGWIPWVFKAEMNQRRRGTHENRLQPQGI